MLSLASILLAKRPGISDDDAVEQLIRAASGWLPADVDPEEWARKAVALERKRGLAACAAATTGTAPGGRI